MTARQLIEQLSPYAGEEIEQVVTESGESITGVRPDDAYIVLDTSAAGDSLTVDALIAGLGQCDAAMEVVTDGMADIRGAAYECIVYPTVYLKYRI